MLFSRKLQISHDSVIQMKHLLAAIFLHLTTQRAGCMFTGFFKFQSLTWPSFPSWRLTSEPQAIKHHEAPSLSQSCGGTDVPPNSPAAGGRTPRAQWPSVTHRSHTGGWWGKSCWETFTAQVPSSTNLSQPLPTPSYRGTSRFPSGLNSMLVTYLSRRLLFIFPFP